MWRWGRTAAASTARADGSLTRLEERTESQRGTRTSGTPSARGLALEQSLRGVVAPAIRRCYRGLDPFDGRRARSATAHQPGTGTADAPLIPLQPPCRGVAGRRRRRRRRDAHKAPARRKDRQRRQGRAPGRGMESVGNPHKLLFRSCGSTRNACRALPAPPARSAPASKTHVHLPLRCGCYEMFVQVLYKSGRIDATVPKPARPVLSLSLSVLVGRIQRTLSNQSMEEGLGILVNVQDVFADYMLPVARRARTEPAHCRRPKQVQKCFWSAKAPGP
jgi:hypothetical protein